MKTDLLLQSAPEESGPVGAATTGTWSGTSVPAARGVFLGGGKATYTFTVDALGGGTVGTDDLVIDWTDGTESGTVEFSSSYTAGDYVSVANGIGIALGSGTIVGGDDFSVDARVARRVRADHLEFRSDDQPLGLWIKKTVADVSDSFGRVWGGDRYRVRDSIARAPQLELDWLDGLAYRNWLEAVHERHQMTLAENYDAATVFLWRTGGARPLIGAYPDFSRAAIRMYLDPRTGLIRSRAAGEPNFSAPIADGSGAAIPQVFLHEADSENLVVQSHPKTGTFGWAATTGTPTLSLSKNVRDVIDLDDANWPTDFGDGVLKVEMAAGDIIQSTNVTGLNGSLSYCGQVWMRGRGLGTLRYRTNSGGTTRDTEAVILTGQETDWTRVRTRGGQGGDTDGLFEFEASEDCVVFISLSALTSGFHAGLPLPSNGSAFSGAADSMTFPQEIPVGSGTLSLWAQFLLDGGTGNYRWLDCGDFALYYDKGNNRLEWHTGSSGPLLITANLDTDDLHHIALAWNRGGAGSINRLAYLDGAIVTADSTANWTADWGPDLRLNVADASTQHGWGVAEMRIDSRNWSDAEVAAQYDRYTDAEWGNVVRQFSGRRFFVQTDDEQYVNEANRDKYKVAAKLLEAGVYEDALLVRR